MKQKLAFCLKAAQPSRKKKHFLAAFQIYPGKYDEADEEEDEGGGEEDGRRGRGVTNHKLRGHNN